VEKKRCGKGAMFGDLCFDTLGYLSVIFGSTFDEILLLSRDCTIAFLALS